MTERYEYDAETKVWVAYNDRLRIATQGTTLEEAKRALSSAVALVLKHFPEAERGAL